MPVSTMPGRMQAFANRAVDLHGQPARLLTGGYGTEQLLDHSPATYLPGSLLWSAGIIAVFAPLTVYRLRRS